jgi:hypothetical protein
MTSIVPVLGGGNRNGHWYAAVAAAAVGPCSNASSLLTCTG